MADNSGIRKGSLQFYPRVRAKKAIPSVNWRPVTKEKGLMGFVGYKVGMVSVTQGMAPANTRVAANSPMALAHVNENPASKSRLERGSNTRPSTSLVFAPSDLAIMSSPLSLISLKRLAAKLMAKGAET